MTAHVSSHRVLVVERNRVASDVIALRLRPTESALPGWTPGAHIDVALPSGLVRQYSLCGSTGLGTDYRIAVLRQGAGRGGSSEIHDRLRVGSEVTISGPRNRFELVAADGYVFVAGGIGITPLLPMIESVAAAGAPWRLLYAGRSRSAMPFLDRLQGWAGQVEVFPGDEGGRMNLEALLADSAGSAVYACGPAALVEAARAIVTSWPAGSFHTELFAAEPRSAPADVPAAGFEVQLGHDGPVLTVAAGTSILQTVLDAGADVLYSCGEGTCGSCETTVLEGAVHHEDSLLSPQERAAGAMLICVSRAAGARLVLDIEPPL